MARAMKDSGIPWIGEIPEGWTVKKLKYCSAFLQNKYDNDGDLQYIGLENIVSWNGKYIETDSVYDKEQSLTFEKDDILWGKLRPYLAKVYHSTIRGCCSSEFCVIRVNSEHVVRFFWNLLVSSEFVYTVDRSTYGTKMPRANADYIKNIEVPVPPYSEQRVISSFLDTECARIDAIIEKTRASIEEYKKLKQAVITEAVTKGIRPGRKMKDSGIAWIGEIPEEWEVRPLKAYIDILPGYAFSSDDFSTECGIPLLRGINVSPGSIRWDDTVYWDKPVPEQLEQFRLNEGDLVVGLDRPWVSEGTRVAFITRNDLPSLLLQRVCRIRAKNNIELRFVFHLLSGRSFEEALSTDTTGVSVPHISTKQIQNYTVAIPPNDEQIEICDYLDMECAKINNLVESKQKLLIELEGYKKAIIYEYVTGKKEV